jgi:hypothetical protein
LKLEEIGLEKGEPLLEAGVAAVEVAEEFEVGHGRGGVGVMGL